ncbi:MAG TPA: FkbM family methyltransferase [Candidatus Kapabacteria bacterium]|nr:FkbM family methyltransferase [Candidatus Kapabacteria bacterium]
MALRVRLKIVRSWASINRAKFKHPDRTVAVMGFDVSYAQRILLAYLFREIFIEGCYLFQTDNKHPRIVDCGSNIGMSILFFKSIYPNARIIGFEPDPSTFEKLKSNIERNALMDVTVYPFALSDNDGAIDFYHNEKDAGSLVMSVHKERIAGQKIIVPSRKLSSFITEPVDLLKLDIEGAEEEVLPELASSGALRLVKRMFLEYHHHIIPEKNNLSETLSLLEKEGFGYQIAADVAKGKFITPGEFQDVRIYCYRKNLHPVRDEFVQ